MPTVLCSEFLLAAACSRWPPSAQRTQAIVAAAACVQDWQRFLRVVTRHRIAALVHAALKSAAIAIPTTVMQQLANQAGQIGFQNLVQTAECVRLQRQFDRANISILFCKGVVLSVLAYDNLALKHGKDIDVLIAKSDVPAALKLLEDAGYELWQPAPRLSESQLRLVLRYGKELALLQPHTDLQVELHWQLVDNPSLLRGVDVHAATRSVSMGRAGELRTLTEGDLFAYLCVHGACHGWARLKWLADVAALLGDDSQRIDALYAAACKLGAGRCAGQALLLCRRLFATPLPAPLAERIASERSVRWLEALALQIMAGPHADMEREDQPFASTRIVLMAHLLDTRWRYRWQELQRQLMVIPIVLRARLPVPLAWLSSLYFLLRAWRRLRHRGRAAWARAR